MNFNREAKPNDAPVRSSVAHKNKQGVKWRDHIIVATEVKAAAAADMVTVKPTGITTATVTATTTDDTEAEDKTWKR